MKIFNIFKSCNHEWFVDGVLYSQCGSFDEIVVNRYSFVIKKRCLFCSKSKLLNTQRGFISQDGRDEIYTKLLEIYKKANESKKM